MQKLPETVKNKANIIVIAYPIFCLLYWIWLWILYRDMYKGVPGDIYWDGFYLLNISLKILAIAGFCLFLFSLFRSNLQRAWIIISSNFVPVACAMFLFWFLIPTYTPVTKARFDGHTYFVLYHRNFLNYYDWILLKCAPFQISCEHISLYYDEYGQYDESSIARFIVDETSQELHAVIDNDLFYTIGSPTREYVHSTQAKLGDYTYYLSRYENESSVFYNLHQCNSRFACTKLPFLYTVSRREAEDRQFDLDVDLPVKTIKVWSFNRWSGLPWEVVFSYDNAPHCYVEACSIPEQ